MEMFITISMFNFCWLKYKYLGLLTTPMFFAVLRNSIIYADKTIIMECL